MTYHKKKHTTPEVGSNNVILVVWLPFRPIGDINTLTPRHNGRHFADDIFKCIFLNENDWIPIKIPLKFVPKGSINCILALVQIMAWRRPGDKPLTETLMVRLLTHICVTRPQWVKWQSAYGPGDGGVLLPSFAINWYKTMWQDSRTSVTRPIRSLEAYAIIQKLRSVIADMYGDVFRSTAHSVLLHFVPCATVISTVFR